MQRSAHLSGLLAAILGITLAYGASVAAQADPFIGNWVLNVEKSEFMAAGAAVRSRTLDITAKGATITHAQSTYRVGQDAVTRLTYDAKYDGKDYPATGGAFGFVALTRKGNTLVRVAKERGMEVETATYTVSRTARR